MFFHILVKVYICRNQINILKEIIGKINRLGKEKVPFLFIIDFDMKNPIITPLADINPNRLLFSVNGVNNSTCKPYYHNRKLELLPTPVSKSRYEEAFSFVQQHIKHGNSFLVNLTMPSNIETNFGLEEIFHRSNAKYKLWVKKKFVVFSPEIFIQIKGQKISSFPMKGTMDASVQNAKQKLLESEKELAEHYTIVDLIRNDLSMVSKNVVVEDFRYIDEIITNKGGLLQMSSKISGELPDNFYGNIGDILFAMLPAGSISGAPKVKTLQIIKDAEKYSRGYYTGVFGIFDGENVDSGVMIRYIEQSKDGLIYKSGGGITAQSTVDDEYQELVDKIYIPVG